MNVLAVIPARGGSKRLPGKNLRPLGGHPLIAWSIEDGLAAKRIDRVIVSTDDPATADVARREGAEVPFMRPPALAGDRIADTPVLAHAAGWLSDREDWTADAIVLLRPTTPFRTDDLIDRCIERLIELEADSVRSVRNVGHWHPYWMLEVDERGFSKPFLPGKSVDNYYQSQMLPPLYKHDGYCDVIRRANLPNPCPPEATLAGVYGEQRAVLVNDDGPLINIDTIEDWRAAEAYLENA